MIAELTLKNTKDELPKNGHSVLVWRDSISTWKTAVFEIGRVGSGFPNPTFFIGRNDGSHDVEREGHTFWTELPTNPENKI